MALEPVHNNELVTTGVTASSVGRSGETSLFYGKDPFSQWDMRDTSDAFSGCNDAPPIRSPLCFKGSEVPPWLADSVGLGDCGWRCTLT